MNATGFTPRRPHRPPGHPAHQPRLQVQHGKRPRAGPARGGGVPCPRTGPPRDYHGDAARHRATRGVRDDAVAGRAHSYSDLLSGYFGRVRQSRLDAVLAHMEAHADQPSRPASWPGRLYEHPGAAGDLPARARDVADGAPAPDPAQPRSRRLVACQRLGHPDQRHRAALGFFHPSRFARQYRERFGELVSIPHGGAEGHAPVG